MQYENLACEKENLLDVQQQLREHLHYHEAEVQRLKDIEGCLQESSEKVKAAPGEGGGARLSSRERAGAEEEQGW